MFEKKYYFLFIFVIIMKKKRFDLIYKEVNLLIYMLTIYKNKHNELNNLYLMKK